MQTVEPTKDKLNNFVLANRGSFQQSWQWGELQERMNRPVRRFLIFDGGLKTSVTNSDSPIAAATFVRHDLKFGKYYWLCPKGPVGNFQFSIFNFQKVLGGVFVRIEPDSRFQIPDSAFKKAPKDHNPRATIIIDLTKSEDDLLAAMHGKTRYNINLARKKSLKIEEWTPASAGVSEENAGMAEKGAGMTELFFELLQKTARRDKFYLHPKKYYGELLKMSDVKLFGCYHDDLLIAAAMVSFWGDTATYLHGASDYEHRALMAPYLLHWEIIKAVKVRGLKYYDFGGVAPKDEPNHYLAGVTRFKSGWGGKYIEYAGSRDYVMDNTWYQIYSIARKIM